MSLEFPVERGPPQADLPGRFRRRHPALHQQKRCFPLVLIQRGPSWTAAFGAGVGQAITRPFGDQSPFKLGNRAEDVKHQLAGGRRGIELFLQGEQRDAALLECLDDIKQFRGADRPNLSSRTTASVSPGRR